MSDTPTNPADDSTSVEPALDPLTQWLHDVDRRGWPVGLRIVGAVAELDSRGHLQCGSLLGESLFDKEGRLLVEPEALARLVGAIKAEAIWLLAIAARHRADQIRRATPPGQEPILTEEHVMELMRRRAIATRDQMLGRWVIDGSPWAVQPTPRRASSDDEACFVDPSKVT